MSRRARLVAVAVLALGPAAGCSFPDVPDWLRDREAAGPPAEAPAGEDWAFVAASSYGPSDDDGDVAGRRPLTGPTVVYAGYRGEGEPERDFSVAELEQAGFGGFSAPPTAGSVEGPNDRPGARPEPFQPLSEVPR